MRYAIAYIDYARDPELYLEIVHGKNWLDALIKIDNIDEELLSILKNECGTKKEDLANAIMQLNNNNFSLLIKEI